MAALEDDVSCTYDLSEKKDGETIISFRGRMDMETSSRLLKDLKTDLRKKNLGSLFIDLGQVSYFDDFGALVLFELKDEVIARKGKLELFEPPDPIKKVLTMVNFYSPERCALKEKKKRDNIFERLGGETIAIINNIRCMISFLGSIFLSFSHAIKHPLSFRTNDSITFMEKIGVNALPIVGLISFLLGSVIAFMSSLQLEQFGANIFVASLVAIAMVSELGPIMTAIVVAGRSGSAIAAEIGTMKISEEIDALVTMGFDPTLFLAAPRIVASLVVVPLLTLFSGIFGIAGGLVVGVLMLDLTATSYISQTMETLTLFEVMWGMGKSIVFALLIAWVGCLRGFQTKGGADAVGNAATSSVVTSIFLIILFDSMFAVIRSYL